MNATEHQIHKFLEPFSNDIVLLTLELRKYLKEETKPTTELVGDSTISLNIGYGFTEKAWDCFCAIIVYSKHINISFPSGAFLSDPHSLLKGSGKKIRHIRINEVNNLTNPAAKDLLMEAKNRALEAMEKKPKTNELVRTIIKQISGVKKRPNKLN